MSVPRRSLTRREWPTGEPVFSLEVQPEHVRDELLVLRLEHPRFRSLLHPCFPGRDDGDLGHGEKTVHEDQEQKKQEFHGNRLERRSWHELYRASSPTSGQPEAYVLGVIEGFGRMQMAQRRRASAGRRYQVLPLQEPYGWREHNTFVYVVLRNENYQALSLGVVSPPPPPPPPPSDRCAS